jgi:DNA-directed RNA polymerase specialized sigma24 family protein
MTAANQYANINWERIRKILVVREGQLRIAERVVNATTTGDLASEVITEFLNHRNRLGWDPKKGALESFLLRVLDRKWMDHPIQEAKAGGSQDDHLTDTETAEKAENRLFEDPEPGELLRRVREFVANDSELLEIIEAVDMLGGDSDQPNQQMSDLIGITVKDVENRKKRLRKALSGLA